MTASGYKEKIEAALAACFETLGAALDAMSPLRVLSRGYSLTEDGQGRLLRSVEGLNAGEQIRVRLSDGRLDCRVERVEKGE